MITMLGSVNCEVAADILYHEAWHSTQPAGMSVFDREVDAYLNTERWTIQKGLSGWLKFRREDEFGNIVPIREAIERHVLKLYLNTEPGASPPTETAVDKRDTPPETLWENNETGERTWRPAEEGNLVLRDRVERIGEGLIDSSQFYCES